MTTRSSATAERQRVSYAHVFLGSLTDRGEVNREETRVVGLSSSEDRMIVASVILTQCQRVTDRQTDGFTITSTALCIASSTDAL